MTQSPEYPDLPWMPPKSWDDSNRSSVQLVVIHTTEGSASASSAEDGAAYDQRRTDGTSTHYFHDSDSTIQCVRTADQAHAARTQGNRRGIQHELCTRAGSANWADAYHQAMLRKAARQAARDSKKWGIPVRHLTVAEVAAGVKGFCGHWDITRAFPQDNGSHTDPGLNFPWTQFLDMVRAELDGDDMATAEDNTADLLGTVIPYPYDPDHPTRTVKTQLSYIPSLSGIVNAVDAKLATRFAALTTAVSGIDTDEQAIATSVLAGLDLTGLATSIAQAVSADLPDGVEVSAEQLQAAIVGALRELAAPAPPAG